MLIRATYQNHLRVNNCVVKNSNCLTVSVFTHTVKYGQHTEAPYTVEIVEIKETLFDKIAPLNNTRGGQCVEFIQRYFGTFYTHPAFRGAANDIVPNANEPKIGGVVLTNEGQKGHAAIIIEKEGDYLILAESNYLKNKAEIINVGRRLNIHNEHIVGYFNF